MSNPWDEQTEGSGSGGAAESPVDDQASPGTAGAPPPDGSSSEARSPHAPGPEHPPQRTIEQLLRPGVFDLTDAEEQQLRDHLGYAPSETRTKAERQETADRIVAKSVSSDEDSKDALGAAYDRGVRGEAAPYGSRSPQSKFEAACTFAWAQGVWFRQAQNVPGGGVPVWKAKHVPKGKKNPWD